MIHKAWCSIEKVPYYFSMLYIKFQGHGGWIIDDLEQIWARLLDRSQPSNPSDLPCSLRRPFVHGLFVSWGATGWRFIINFRANIHVTIDFSTVLPLVFGVVTRQKPQINGSVVLGADESPWPCGTPIWYTPLPWMILNKQKNLHLFSSQCICVFL